MKNTFALILMMGIAAGASAQSVADYGYFKNEGIFDPGYPTERPMRLFGKGSPA